jgi:peptidoglycan/xylan/chitin deacetylase (PgdA/CDA1 family)
MLGLARSSAWWASGLVAVGMYVLGGRRPRAGLTVLAYRMSPRHPWRHVTPERFSDQLRSIGMTKGVSIVGLSQVERWRSHPPDSGSYVLLTFDDGLQRHLHAAAELSRYALSGAFFIPSGPLPSGAPANEEERLDPDGIRLLVRLGMYVQPRGHEHHSLGRLTPEALAGELDHSLSYCAHFAHPFSFAYPGAYPGSHPGGSKAHGDVTDEVTQALCDRGIRLAFTTEIGRNTFRWIHDEPLRLKRVPMAQHDRRIFAQAKAAGYSGPLPPLRRLALRIGRALGL